MKNLNLIFNKVYYSEIKTVNFNDLDRSDRAASQLSRAIEEHNRQICSCVFDHSKDYKGLNKDVAPHQFLMKTVYPGLIIGSGNPHGAQLCDNDINNGFSFDYVTGQPYIPGSSVKGVLRSCFKDFSDAVSEILRQEFPDFTHSIKELEDEIFDGNDIFFDSVIYSGDTQGKLLGTDYITPHPDEIKAPCPIMLLKLLPDVRLKFSFCLSDGLLTAEEKCKLFIILLSIFGAGAKTNTGYGRLEYTENEAITAPVQNSARADTGISNKETIVCKDCGKTHILTDFEKDKIKNEGWKIIRCRQCSILYKQQRQQNGRR